MFEKAYGHYNQVMLVKCYKYVPILNTLDTQENSDFS